MTGKFGDINDKKLLRERMKQWRRGHERANEVRREELRRMDEYSGDVGAASGLPAASDLPAACGLVNLQGKLLRNYVRQLKVENDSLRKELAELKGVKAEDHADVDS